MALPTILASLVALALGGASCQLANAATAPAELWRAPEDLLAGDAAGRFDGAQGVAADPMTGHVFVEDAINARVDEFTAFGQFVKAWGWGVADGGASLQTCGPEATPPTATCQKGIWGDGPGQFASGEFETGSSGGVAVGSDGSVYVADFENQRVQKFSPVGAFVWMIGSGVDQGPNHPGDICRASYIAEGDVCGAGAKSSADGGFDHPSFIRESSQITWDGGTLYVADIGRVQEFDGEGAFRGKITLQGSLAAGPIKAIAPATGGDLWLVCECDPTHVHKVGAAGSDLLSPIPAEEAWSLAAGSGGSVFVSTTNAVPRTEEVEGEKEEFVARSIAEVLEFDAAGAPILGIGNGFSRIFARIPNQGGVVAQQLGANAVTAAGDYDVYSIVSIRGGTEYLSAYGPAPDKWPPPLNPPTILSQFSESVGTTDATVRALINPHLWADTTYYVEYGTGVCSLGGCPQMQPAVPAELGARVDGSVATKPIILLGLKPRTTYHYRFVAQSSGGGPTVGIGAAEEEETFITPPAPSGENTNCPNQALRFGPSAKLVDCRAYEMVTPVEKNNTDIVSLININSNPATLDQSSISGEKLAYTTSQGFGDSVGTPYVSQYIASRGAEGWSSHSISPPQGVSLAEPGFRIDIEFHAFTPDLCGGMLLHATDPPLAPGAEEHEFNLYRRQNCGEEGYEALLPGRPVTYGISTDGRCAVYGGNLLPIENGKGTVFETCDGRQRKVSVLPNGKASEGTVGTFSAGIQPRSGTRLRAVSEDASKVYWTGTDGKLYLRINASEGQSKVEGGECVDPERACTLPVSQTVSNEAAHFMTASPDGAKAVFALEAEGTGSSRLYEYDLESRVSTLIAPEALQTNGPMVPVLGSSGDPDHLFFVSRAALTGANVEGREPTAGDPNIYFYDAQREGADRYRFVGTLAGSDVLSTTESNGPISPVASQSYLSAARVSPNGLHLAFTSSASLTGYNNTDARNGRKDLEVFSYDATAEGGAGRLFCISCNPTGQVPEGRNIEVEIGIPSGSWGAALLPLPATELYASRVISDDGSRIFFDSFDALLPRDTNGKADVYEWEARSAGDCDETDSNFSATNGGCLNLISTGESATDSRFVDASPDGRDVFFTTASSLAPQDVGLIDIYDAREGGGYPAPPSPRPACEGEACQGPLAPPNDPTPASAAFEGAGNVKPTPTTSRCGKGKARRKGRCVARKHSNRKSSKHKGNDRKKRSNHNRRNAR